MLHVVKFQQAQVIAIACKPSSFRRFMTLIASLMLMSMLSSNLLAPNFIKISVDETNTTNKESLNSEALQQYSAAGGALLGVLPMYYLNGKCNVNTLLLVASCVSMLATVLVPLFYDNLLMPNGLFTYFEFGS
uniref:Uncharacterized protein n=1 Tax=Ditylenchus dipsaci TaxID=166011 RepID=A0A915EN16_9BILA